MDDYSDIIDHQHHISKNRHPMSMQNRAAQFSAFAVLTGYDEAVEETARLTDVQHELTDEQIDKLNKAFQTLVEIQSERPMIAVTYFKADEYKFGGTYVTIEGELKSLNEAEMKIQFADGQTVPIDAISKLQFRPY